MSFYLKFCFVKIYILSSDIIKLWIIAYINDISAYVIMKKPKFSTLENNTINLKKTLEKTRNFMI